MFRMTAAAGVTVLAGLLSAQTVAAADLPAIKATDTSPVMKCATPGRLTSYLKARNERLDPRFAEIAVEYMRHGEELGMRWDYAFFQMLLETGNLKFGGDVRPSQNNFAGLGATGGGEHGESFKTVSDGVRAHLQHLLMYSGEKVENPVAERTRKVQEWGVLTEWQKSIKGPLTFAQLARKWAPPARKYAHELEQVADAFIDGPCKDADPNPEMIAMAKPAGKAAAVAVAAVVPEKPAQADAVGKDADDKVSGADLMKRQVAEARAEGGKKRSGLGAAGSAKAALAAQAEDKAAEAKSVEAKIPDAKTAETAGDAKPQAFALLNAPKPDVEAQATDKKVDKKADTTASAADKAAAGKPAAKPAGCKVFTASYGGSKAIIIKAMASDVTSYTVLDVNEGAESREAEAYIAAYAPGGKQVGEFKTQASALDKAFELCPEG